MPKRPAHKAFHFCIDGFTVDSMPMGKLAEYVSDLAAVMGEPGYVHLASIEAGSVAFTIHVDAGATRVVRARMRGKSPDAQAALDRLGRRLADDGVSATLTDEKEKNILHFPDATRPRKIGPLKQEGSVDGVPIRIGGKGKKVPVHLKDLDGAIHVCETTRDIAKKIARHLFQDPIRAQGQGSWFRWPDGQWERQSFTIQSFDLLDSAEFDATIQRIREMDILGEQDGSPMEELRSIRNGSGA